MLYNLLQKSIAVDFAQCMATGAEYLMSHVCHVKSTLVKWPSFHRSPELWLSIKGMKLLLEPHRVGGNLFRRYVFRYLRINIISLVLFLSFLPEIMLLFIVFVFIGFNV